MTTNTPDTELADLRARIAELEGHLQWAVTAADRLAETTPSGVLRTGIRAKADEIRSTLTQDTPAIPKELG